MTRAEWRAAVAARQNIILPLMDAAEYDDELECEVFTPRQLTREIEELLKVCHEDEDLCLIETVVGEALAQFLRELMPHAVFRPDCSPVILTDDLLEVHARLTIKNLGGIEDDGRKNDTPTAQSPTL